MDLNNLFPYGLVQDSKMWMIGRRLRVLLVGGVLVLAPSIVMLVQLSPSLWDDVAFRSSRMNYQ